MWAVAVVLGGTTTRQCSLPSPRFQSLTMGPYTLTCEARTQVRSPSSRGRRIDVLEAGLLRIVVDAAQRLVAPGFEIAGEDLLTLTVHAAVLRVGVPAFPTGRGALGDHVPPARTRSCAWRSSRRPPDGRRRSGPAFATACRSVRPTYVRCASPGCPESGWSMTRWRCSSGTSPKASGRTLEHCVSTFIGAGLRIKEPIVEAHLNPIGQFAESSCSSSGRPRRRAARSTMRQLL